jgi:hypothetical protein
MLAGKLSPIPLLATAAGYPNQLSDVGDPEALAQHLDDEGFGALAGQLGIEMQHEQVVDAHGLELAGLDPQRRQAERRLVRAEELARMGLEGEDRVGGAEFARLLGGRGDHRLVAAMDAVEIAERDDRAPRLDGNLRIVAKQPHAVIPVQEWYPSFIS